MGLKQVDSNLARCGQSKLTEMVMGKPLVRLNRLNFALDLPLPGGSAFGSIICVAPGSTTGPGLEPSLNDSPAIF